MNRFLTPFVLGLLVVAGCASSKDTAGDETPPYYLGAFEDFDAEKYEEVIPPVAPASAEHDIPERLEAKTSTGSKMARGFRVQVFSSLSRPEANDAMQSAITWWEDQSDRVSARPPIYIEYEQPYYKVRVGNFTSRDAATRMAGRLERVFDGAFVVPSLVETR